MPIVKWEPFGELDRFFEERPYLSLFPTLGWDLAIDLYEEDDAVVATMNLPGIDPDELDISVDEDTLTVSGSRKEEEETEEKEYYSKEIRRGSFSRTVQLPKSVDASGAEAEYKDGVLVVTMPVIAGTKERVVSIKVRK
ncbi:Hsp20/alpha crystallin family protein [Patescibacteria group bacterium]|nr:Hsp20/alpha crystallin family protein [Patescibacteria group bacterium]